MNDLNSFPNLTTKRLQLRQLRPTDAPEIFALRSNEIVNRYLDRAKANSIEDGSQFITKILNSSGDTSIYWGICFKSEQKLIGTICIWNISEDRSKAEIGYELLPEFHGKGLMQEAIESVIRYCFHNMKLQCIEAVLVAANMNSVKLLEKNKFVLDTDPQHQVENLIVYILEKPATV